ncbi:exodeoxyribonuclease V subunit gamma [Massilia sp. TS11]|uniref:exodeoxyribonuclease V subunit gamma n=1 Tax=Massilia sp. TS11 TaxID=2908003 RepID=UPI001EDB3899|nr:exodeoxyribonuclease V subunit gamma [Massilia sp. TS11]MCG2584015.1 exodeoxyribonuclease V subunit gamma [Massilia sp. TS11]
MSPRTPLQPGLLILHGNQLESLRDAVLDWLARHPLDPLEQETLLVQSNGIAEWMKVALASHGGICAATRVVLPARFLWEAYREVLGREQVPRHAPFDKAPLTWRLMHLLPALLGQPVFAPLRHFLADGDPERRLQLAARLADLYDQYQVYRADWLRDWEAGRDQLRGASGSLQPLADDQRWQAALWRGVCDSVPAAQRGVGRVSIHENFVQALQAGAAPQGRVVRRVVVFGVSALPYQTLQALAALARVTQVLVAVPNPCQFYWGDIIDGRELLRAHYKRQRQRGADLAQVPLEQLHAHSHPLLAAWGRQGRDFVRMLDEFDPGTAAAPLRVDLFNPEPGAHLLGQVQEAVRDLLPLNEHAFPAPQADDDSISFSIAHSAQREVEILHDRLLDWFARDPTLRPRDVVVMVPDIDTFSAAIHAVFDQFRRGDARTIPYEIGDVRKRTTNPLVAALEWLLRLPQQRCRQSEVRDLLDVPAVARRFGLRSDDLPVLGRWIAGAQVRWGLDQEHRASLGLGAAGEQNAWLFGLRRMLLGYASGAGEAFQDIEPYAEVGGLDAALAGALARLVDALLTWRGRLAQQATPAVWAEHARALLAAFFDPADEEERLTLATLEQALQSWLDTCARAAYTDSMPLAVLREAWLGTFDEPALNHQFVSGGVTFCTLMPMRAVPFRVVCLLGMNDGDFPRRAPKADFDLLALPGMHRPGDRSRRDDDRYLMLEALLAARDRVYISWCGRNPRDNSEQPPSVLVAQLRDYLAAGWPLELARLTSEHPLQAFSRRYFEAGGLHTHAREWRAAHAGEVPALAELGPCQLPEGRQVSLRELARLLRNPAREFFRLRLGVVFRDEDDAAEDEEPFATDGLQRYQLQAALLADAGPPELPSEVARVLDERSARLLREGRLPIGGAGAALRQELMATIYPARLAWVSQCAAFPDAAPKLALSLDAPEASLFDWVEQIRVGAAGRLILSQSASKLCSGEAPRPDKLIEAWLLQLACAAMDEAAHGILVGADAQLLLAPAEPEAARGILRALLALWRANLDAPLPTACLTGLAVITQGKPRQAYESGDQHTGEGEDPALARLWPDYASLAAEPAHTSVSQALYGAFADWLAEAVQVQAYGQEEGA